ncbi:APC family permease [Leucobacter massiliensis]|uniref:Putrescine importer PuuP n=1 Tax=Leucobacter massiliensis TaxID=1686285 RepID=A0A2S9QNW4_9MICO|nr:APC family permease [Leucobacter massiliensis]PRI11277.1 Putrescine importer PuuP [Leucobacter massiliensis]
MSTETTSAQRPRLKRELGLLGLTLFGVTYMTVITVFTTYGIVNQVTDGHLPASYVVAVVTMLFTAGSYAAMVRKYPVAGSAYTYTQQSFGGAAGFLTGWVMLLDYLFIPMINFMLIGIYLNTEFPAIPVWVFTLAALLLVLLFNVLGITLVNKANFVIIALSVVLVVVFMALAFKEYLGGDMSVGILEPFSFGEGGIGAVASGAAILALSFLGFDAVSTLSEEAKRPRKDIPRAIVLATLVGGLFFILVSWSGGLAFHPDWSTLTPEQIDAAGTTVMDTFGVDWLTSFFVAVYVVGAFGSGMTGQVSVSRILYAMGRDGMLPRPLSRLHRRFGTPVVAACVVSVFALSALFLPLDVVAFMISFGALAAFAMVNLSVIRTYLFPRGGRQGPLTAWQVIRYGVLPLIGFALTIWLWTSLEATTWLVGLIWLAVGVVIIALVTGFFKRPVPKMDFSESDPTTEQIDQLAEEYPLEGTGRA